MIVFKVLCAQNLKLVGGSYLFGGWVKTYRGYGAEYIISRGEYRR